MPITRQLIKLKLDEHEYFYYYQVWSDVTPLTFTPSTCSPVDIAIRFASGDHGDGNPFDGQWGVLGHAYYPYDNSMDWHGDAHFDEAENWILDYTDDGKLCK